MAKIEISGLRKQLAHRRNRTDSHDLRRNTSDGKASEITEERTIANLVFGSHHQRSGSVGERRAISRRDRARRIKRRTQTRQLGRIGIATRKLVTIDLDATRLARLVEHRGLDRKDLTVEKASLLRGHRFLMALIGELILLTARNLEATGDVFSGHAHWRIERRLFLDETRV